MLFHARIEFDLTAFKGHFALWKNGVRHRDVSPSNLMYKAEGNNVFGVLNDFDLATVVDGVTGYDRTGTVPFMAIDLLTEEGLAGKIKHIYAHDAESFIWTLTWLCLRYEDGKLRVYNRPLDQWLKVDALACGKEKLYFLWHPPEGLTAGKGHEQNWLVAKECLVALAKVLYGARYFPAESLSEASDQEVLEKLLQEPLRNQVLEAQGSGVAER